MNIHEYQAKQLLKKYGVPVLPGGVANPDALRLDEDAVTFVKNFVASGKPVAAICHAPWVLVEADVVRGKRLASFPSVQTDIRNAGGEWVDETVVVDGKTAFDGLVKKDLGTLMTWAARDNDRTMLYGAELAITVP